ncbi:MAG: crotonase/enoyl-CoA hydratase family protein [Novosphingobium sp.]|uniref:crotonase/enoyl-CoA hydratase family protein n=1 Tax=Novosphingobium sp. TaxID=1874826 RepID=UPI001D6E95CA|nr:crotonase/enoyl-CoA hydratase family protein [Novosphingobium sp.]MCB2057518.1 crotonase/enoyl-CoA hydratase family protein [Novosphingobium sp.]MCP5385903.1 crotonase/enoyl-CoA hydratase family protein [Novosphingobium sp.]
MLFEVNPGGRVAIAMGPDGVAQVRLIRADKMNAIDPDMFAALIDAGRVLHETKGLRAVVLAGEGRSFCAGLDLSSMANANRHDRAPLTERTHGNANHAQQVAMQWRKLPVPVIAAVHGVCFGGGLQIASGADIRVVDPAARMAVMEMKWGLVPDMGGYALWRGLVRDDVLRELTYTNREFSGEQAQDLGFATLVDANPVARATAIATEIASRNPHAQRAAKRLFNKYLEASTDEILMAESVEQQALIGSKNQIEAVMSQMEGRKGEFTDP